jgi:chorismate lyase/3-hydroxybenzoate synthase
VQVALKPLQSGPVCEIWQTRGPVVSGQWQDIAYSSGESITFGQLALDEDRFDSIADTTQYAYEQILGFLATHEHPWLWKIWHYIPRINSGDGDLERYRQFCIGRAEALGDDPAARPAMPAATAIGTSIPGNVLQVYFLCGPRPGLHVENPRQVEPAHYPLEYGKQSPLFSRGTIITDNGNQQFLISGTASILGHKTHHRDDCEAQINETLRNVQALVAESQRHYSGTVTADTGYNGLLKVYVREPRDLDIIAPSVAAQMGKNTPVVYLQGDICRQDLLTEVEGIRLTGKDQR